MRKLICALFIIVCSDSYGCDLNEYVFRNMDLEDLNEKIECLPFDFSFSGINQLIFVAPEPYLSGFIIKFFQEEKTERLIVEFSKETGFQDHITFWKNKLIRYFAFWDQDKTDQSVDQGIAKLNK